jgi:phosphoenolpyruvate-protein kinase (PTS system EI component)
MFEVPSACIQADAILQRVDFGSIGSNDLIQYLFAVDRDNDLVSQDYNPHHPILWDMLERLSASAHNQGKPLSICGEMAGRKGIPQRLYETGITSLSVSPKLIQRVRHELTHHLSSHTHTHV